MSYGGTEGLYTVFPSAPKRKSSARSASRAPKAKAPCKYGPRLSTGRCPKKPRTITAEVKGYARNVAQAAGAKRGGTGDAVAGALGGAVGSAVARRAKAAVRSGAGSKAAESVLARIGQRGAVAVGFSGIAAAGLISYYVTKRILDARRERRVSRAAAAALAADGYRAARLAAQESNGGRPLTPKQFAVLRDEFHAQLGELGLTTDNLKGL